MRDFMLAILIGGFFGLILIIIVDYLSGNKDSNSD